jgi:hypothetical protein
MNVEQVVSPVPPGAIHDHLRTKARAEEYFIPPLLSDQRRDLLC